MDGMTKKELANAAGYSYQRIYEIDRGLPEGRKLFVENGDGKYSLKEFIRNWVEYKISTANDAPEDLETVKARHEVIKAEKTQLEVDRMRGQLIDLQDVKKLWGDVANTVVQNLLHVPSKAAPMLRMVESTDVIADIIRTHIREALDAVAETPLPTYAEDSAEETEDDTQEE